MVMLVQSETHYNLQLGRRVSTELKSADPQRFGRISVRGLYCGFVELGGVVASNYEKSLALDLVRRLAGVAEVIDTIRVAPVRDFNVAWSPPAALSGR